MRICLVVDKLLRGEGMGEYISEFYKYLSKNNDVEILTRSENVGIPFKKIEWGAPGPMRYFRPYEYGKLRKYDIVVSNYPTVAPILTGIKISKELNIPHVVHDYGIVSSKYFLNFRAKLAHRIETFLMPHLYRKTDQILTISKFLQKDLRGMGFDSEIGYGGITYAKYQEKRGTDILKKFKLKTDGYVLFVGRISEHKGVHKLIEAWKRAKVGMPLVVIGGHPVGDYEKRIKKASEGENIIFTGKLPEEGLIAMLQNCAFYCLASSGEAYNLTILEAMACGKPVILFSAGAPVELVQPDKTALLVKPDNLDDYAEKIARLSRNRALRSKMGKAGREWAKKFDWNVVGKEFERIYSDAIREWKRK